MIGTKYDRFGTDLEFWKGAFFVLLFGGLLLIGLENFQPFYFTHDDNAMQLLPWHVYNYRCLKDYGQLAFINFHQYLGHEHYSSGQTGVLYAPAYIASWLADRLWGSILMSVEMSAALHLLAAMLAMYGYCRAIKLSALAGVYASVLYGSAPFILITSKSGLIFVYTAFYGPALLACLEMWWRRQRTRWLVATIPLKMFFFYQGNIQFVFFYLFGEILYIALRFRIWRIRAIWPRAVDYAFSNILFGLGTLPLLIPMKNYSERSAFRSRPLSLESSLALAIKPLDWIKAQFFLFKEHGVSTSSSAALYLGGSIILLVMLFAVIPIHRSKRSYLWATMAVFIVSLVLATKANILIHWLPPFGWFRWPYKWYALSAFSYAAVFGIVVDQILAQRKIPLLWVHTVFFAVIVSQLLVIFSPKSQVTFGPWHLLPDEVESALETTVFREGRVVPYAIKSASGNCQVLDARTFNFPTLYGEYALGGYDPLISGDMNKIVYGMNHASILYEPLSAEVLKRLSLWSVRYLIVNGQDGLPEGIEAIPSLKEIGTTATGFAILENSAAKPFGRLESQPDQRVDVKFQANQIVADLHGVRGKLILSFYALPGWKYSIDGQNLGRPDSNDEGQMVVSIPAGSEQIVFRFVPPLFLPMALLAVFLGFVLSLIWYLWHRFEKNILIEKPNAECTFIGG